MTHPNLNTFTFTTEVGGWRLEAGGWGAVKHFGGAVKYVWGAVNYIWVLEVGGWGAVKIAGVKIDIFMIVSLFSFWPAFTPFRGELGVTLNCKLV